MTSLSAPFEAWAVEELRVAAKKRGENSSTKRFAERLMSATQNRGKTLSSSNKSAVSVKLAGRVAAAEKLRVPAREKTVGPRIRKKD